jgi:hypothetical protein
MPGPWIGPGTTYPDVRCIEGSGVPSICQEALDRLQRAAQPGPRNRVEAVRRFRDAQLVKLSRVCTGKNAPGFNRITVRWNSFRNAATVRSQ